MVDAAFLEACSRCGVEPFDLQPRTEESFRRPSDEVNDPKVLALRFEGFEKIRQDKLRRVAKEQETVRLMLSSGVPPALVPVEQPWVVGGPKAKDNDKHGPPPPDAAEMVEAMARKQAEREAAMKNAERAALQAALTRQAREIERMVHGEKLTAERAKGVALREKAKAEEKAEEEKIVAKKKKEEAAKKADAMVRAAMEREEDKKRLLKQMAEEKVEAAKEKERLVAEERRLVKARQEAALAADLAVEERRRKTEAVYSEIDARAEENVQRLAAREAAIAERQRLAEIEVAKRNAAKQEAAQERIDAVLDAQRAKQVAKRTAYEKRQEANAVRRAEKYAEEEDERKKAMKRVEDEAKKRAAAYVQAQQAESQRIDKIVAHANERGKVFGEIQAARSEAHRFTVARNENKQRGITENVERYLRIQEVKRSQLGAAIDAEDMRVWQIKQSKKDLLFKRNVAAHDAAIRKQMIQDELAIMKSTQNFKGLKKLTKMAGGGGSDSDPAAATGGAEPASPGTPKA